MTTGREPSAATADEPGSNGLLAILTVLCVALVLYIGPPTPKSSASRSDRDAVVACCGQAAPDLERSHGVMAIAELAKGG